MKGDFYSESMNFSLSIEKLSTFEIQKKNFPFLKKIPKHLYKYRKCGEEGRIDSYLKRREIFSASLNNLNDKFEGITPAVKEKFTKKSLKELYTFYKPCIVDLLSEEFEGFDKNKADYFFEVMIEEDFNVDSIIARLKNQINKDEQSKINQIASRLSYLFGGELENDKNFQDFIKVMMNVNDEIGAYCLCENGCNDNLWAYYASDFKGYCIEYDLTDPCKSRGSIKFIKGLFPMKYVKKRDDDFFKSLLSSLLKSIKLEKNISKKMASAYFQKWLLESVCSKKMRWKYEEEWRYINKGNHLLLGPLISAIIVGDKIGKEDFLKIQKIAKDNYYDLKITDYDYDKQEIITRPITEKDVNKILNN